MRLPDTETLQSLAEPRDHVVASLYLPTEMSGRETLKSPIILKNLVSEAVAALEASSDPKAPAVKEQLETQAAKLLDDGDFWQHQDQGLALLCDAEDCHCIQLPLSPSKGVYLGKHFQIKSLVAARRRNEQFYLLKLSVNQCELLRGDARSLDPVEVPNLPGSLEFALRFDDPEKSLQFHSAGKEGAGQPIYHGQGGAPDSADHRMRRYVKQCASAVDDFLATGGAADPLLLACVDEHVPLYREASNYAGLVADHWIGGNADDKTADQLRDDAEPLLGQLRTEHDKKLLEQFAEAGGGDQTSTDLDEISKAIKQARVGTLFVAIDQTVRGTADPVSGAVEISDKEDAEAEEDLLNVCLAGTLNQGGACYLLPAERVPGDSGVAAIFRY